MDALQQSVALVGRPNVGKSRLFNRLMGKRVSIVHDKPGVTRDIVVEKLSKNVLLMDTGGMGAVDTAVDEKVIARATEGQAKFAIDIADIIVFVVDSQDGLTPLDEEIAALLRSSGKTVILAINKVDVAGHSARASEFYKLGFKHNVEVSAEHGVGYDDLVKTLEGLVGKLEPFAEDDAQDRVKISVAGRPNVGKSSILNRLLGEDRLIVSPVAGTTRDSVKCDMEIPDKDGEPMKFRLFDTAGLRAKRKTNTSLDYLSSLRTRRAIGVADVVFLVIDAKEGVSELDKSLAEEIFAEGASVIVVVNKWDYAIDAFAGDGLGKYKDSREFGREFESAVRQNLPFLGKVPVLFVSALRNSGVEKLLGAAWKMYRKMNSTVATGKLNSILRTMLDENPPKYISGKRFKIYYAVKTSSRPFTIRLFCNTPTALTNSYKRYLMNGLRDKLNLGGVALNLELVGKPKRTAQERISGRDA